MIRAGPARPPGTSRQGHRQSSGNYHRAADITSGFSVRRPGEGILPGQGLAYTGGGCGRTKLPKSLLGNFLGNNSRQVLPKPAYGFPIPFIKKQLKPCVMAENDCWASTLNPQVEGSNPSGRTNKQNKQTSKPSPPIRPVARNRTGPLCGGWVLLSRPQTPESTR
jgi:hypothetical protein